MGVFPRGRCNCRGAAQQLFRETEFEIHRLNPIVFCNEQKAALRGALPEFATVPLRDLHSIKWLARAAPAAAPTYPSERTDSFRRGRVLGRGTSFEASPCFGQYLRVSPPAIFGPHSLD